MVVNERERNYLRELAIKYKALCETEENKSKAQKWYDLNDLKAGTKPLFINHYWPVALSEIFPDDSYFCESQEGKRLELYFKTRMFYKQELNDDNVLEPVVHSLVYNKLYQNGKDLVREFSYADDDHGNIGAYEIIPVLINDEDKDKISDPVYEYDEEKSRKSFEDMQELFGDILTVVKQQNNSVGTKVTDEYSWLRGIEQTYMDLYDDPEWMHEVMGKLTANTVKSLKAYEDAGTWGCLDLSTPLGSAGLRYATGIKSYKEVEGSLFDYNSQLNETWGSSIAEVFNSVSPEMHKEFSYDYAKQFTDLFGLNTIGCCEVLDRKVDLIKDIKNARKYSISEWCDPETAGKSLGLNYVYSYRAAGIHFMPDQWDKVNAEKEIRAVLESAKKYGCNLEIVLNIGGTLGKNPRTKVIEWSHMVRELINEYYG